MGRDQSGTADRPVHDGELPVVWFSSNPTWDYSARANLNLTPDVNGRRIDYKLSFQELCNGLSVAQYQIEIPPTELFRISVNDEIAPMTWEQYRIVSDTPAQILSMMEQEKRAAPQ